jgi:ketosteroid isomerase-like protein
MKKLLPVMLAAAMAALAAGSPSDAVKAAEKAWAVATVAGDEAALDKLLAGDLTYTHSTGDTDSKKVFVANLKSGALRYHKIDHESMDVRVYGNTAVLTTSARIATSRKGGPQNPAHLRFLHVWVLQKGAWQLAAHQSLRLPD